MRHVSLVVAIYESEPGAEAAWPRDIIARTYPEAVDEHVQTASQALLFRIWSSLRAVNSLMTLPIQTKANFWLAFHSSGEATRKTTATTVHGLDF